MTLPKTTRPPGAPQSVTRVIRILDALCASPGPVSLADLSRLLDTPKSSMAALLRGLAEEDFVTVAEGAYRLGPGAFGLGSALLEARRHLQSSDIVRDAMRRLADRSGETVLFAVEDSDGTTMTYVDVIESRNAMRFAVSVGDRRPLYCTAGGLALLAARGEGEIAAYLDALRPKPPTPRTETSPQRLAEIVATVRETGVAQTVDQATDGVTGTAAVVQDATGAVVGALIVAAPSARLSHSRAELVQLVREAATATGRSLGHRKAR